MKKFTSFETQLGESVVLTDKAKLSLYKKSQNSGYSVDILEEVYRRGYHCWNESFGSNPDSFAFDRVNSFIAGGFAKMLDEDLINEKRGLWDNIHAKRARIKAGSGERMRKPGSEGAPTDAALKASQNEDTDPCWKGYKQIGMKNKGGRKVPNCVPTKENAEDHSTNPNNPASRFIGSYELVDIYKKETPGQVIKRIVREQLDEAALAVDMAPPPAVYGQRVPGAKQQQAPRELSGRATGRMVGQTGSMSAKPTVTRTFTRTGSATFGQVGAGPRGGVSPTKITTSLSQGGGQIAQKMATSSPSQMVSKLSDAGRAAMAGAEKAAPTVAKGLGTAARIASGPAATAAMAVMSPTAANAGEDEKKRQETLKTFNPYKSSGRSVSDYEKEVLTPKTYEKPSVPAPKVDAPTPPTRPEFFSRGQAFQAARSEVGGSGGKFSYGGKEYQTNVAGEKYVAKPSTTSVKDETESGGIKKKIKEAISEATYKGKTVPLNKPMAGDVKKSKVFVDPDGDGKAQKVNFGDKTLSIKKHIPARKKSYCARSGGQGNLTDKTSANYWSRRAWNCEETEVNELSVPKATTGSRENVKTPMVAVRMASGKIEKHPPGKSGSSGGGDE